MTAPTTGALTDLRGQRGVRDAARKIARKIRRGLLRPSRAALIVRQVAAAATAAGAAAGGAAAVQARRRRRRPPHLGLLQHAMRHQRRLYACLCQWLPLYMAASIYGC